MEDAHDGNTEVDSDSSSTSSRSPAIHTTSPSSSESTSSARASSAGLLNQPGRGERTTHAGPLRRAADAVTRDDRPGKPTTPSHIPADRALERRLDGTSRVACAAACLLSRALHSRRCALGHRRVDVHRLPAPDLARRKGHARTRSLVFGYRGQAGVGGLGAMELSLLRSSSWAAG